MSCIPEFPTFSQIDYCMKEELENILSFNMDGVSEYSFPVLWLDSNSYTYSVARLTTDVYIITGINPEKFSNSSEHFFILIGDPVKIPLDKLEILLNKYCCWKYIPQSIIDRYETFFEEHNFFVKEDRDNFDYIYGRNQLAELKGKEMHKKKNLVNKFCASYKAAIKELTLDNIVDALKILNEWNKNRINPISDYSSCLSALNHFNELKLTGYIAYANDEPVSFNLGIRLNAKTFCTLYEKGLDEYKGCYQYINMMTAVNLPSDIEEINREQDLGDEGLRQAKLTYRPIRFIKKYTIQIQR